MNNASPSAISSAIHIIASFLHRVPCRAALAAMLCACSSVPERTGTPGPAPQQPAPTPAPVVISPVPGTGTPAIDLSRLSPASFAALPDWPRDRPHEALAAFLRGCDKLRMQTAWRAACEQAVQVDARDPAAARAFFETQFEPFALGNADGTMEGTITGYYEPLLRGSRSRAGSYRHPIHQPPPDMLTVDLTGAHPDLQGRRLRGRLDGRRVVAYHTRADIEAGKAPLHGREIVWIDDPVDVFFLHVQGSGRVMLDDGRTIRVSYADQNGHAYVSVGRLLVERGELTLDQASMQGIRAWGERNPGRLEALLQENPSYVFFRELSADADGPPGSLGVELTAGRSLAVDPRAIPLGAPVFLSTTEPNSTVPLNRLMIAQDTGGAIKGSVRGDFYWGSGDEAGRQAGRMRQSGRMWILLPRGFTADPAAR
ncbi:MAG: MltA domain-containing protein [Burkholderiales bacterium]|nr:MltA domain-containing protein [Burkholderiales bacterium]